MDNPFFCDESDVTQRLIWQHENIMSRCSIAKVTAINASPVSVDIQPLVNYFDPISQWETYPVISSVPVAQMQTISYSINTPLNIGDVGLVLWFDREVYTTLLAGASEPNTPDSGNLSDTNACVFIPTMQPFTLAKTLQSNGVEFTSSGIKLVQELITSMTNLNTTLTDLTSLLTDLTTFSTALTAAAVPYAPNPSDPLPGAYAVEVASIATALGTSLVPIATSIATVTTNIVQVIADLTTFKGVQP